MECAIVMDNYPFLLNHAHLCIDHSIVKMSSGLKKKLDQAIGKATFLKIEPLDPLKYFIERQTMVC